MSKPNPLYPPPEWKNLKTIWTPPAHPEIHLVKIIDPDDLVTWGKYMGHSGGRYQKWICDTPVWHFLTFIDAEGHPHVTIHAKDTKWWGRAHPDDDEAIHQWYWGFGPGPTDKAGKARFWIPSQSYERIDKNYRQVVNIDGHKCFLMGVGHRDLDPLWEGEKALVDQWYVEARNHAG